MFKTKSRLFLALMTLQMLSNICLTIGFSTRKKNITFEFIETDPYEPVLSKLSISSLTTNSTSAPTANSTVASTNTPFQYRDITSWNSDYPACKGQKQSPIALDSKDVLLDQKSPLHWNGYDILPLEMTLSNSGPTLKLVAKWEADKIPFISGGPLVDEYIFGQLHFHWGNNDKSGAEHSMHGQTFPLEMHILHYNKKYGSVGNATKHVDGIAVVAVLFSIKSQNTSLSLDPILDYIPFVVKEQTSVDITPFQLSTLAGIYSPMAFMSYFGSLTTPPCSEVVTWIIPIYAWPVTKLQLSKFRTLKSSQLKLKANNRPHQPLNGRQIYYYNS